MPEDVLDKEACKLLAEELMKNRVVMHEGETLEQITEVVEGTGRPEKKEGMLIRTYFNLTAQMYDLKNAAAKQMYEKDAKEIKKGLKHGSIQFNDYEIGFILHE